MKDHTPPTLQGAARDLRTSLARLKNSALLFASPALREAIPQLAELLECLEETDDRLTLLEKTVSRIDARLTVVHGAQLQEQGMGGAVASFTPTLTEPGVMPQLDYDLSDLVPHS